MRTRDVWHLGILVLLGVGVPATASPQQLTAQHRIPAGGNSDEIWETPVTVRLKGVPLGTALDRIARISGVRIYYQVELVRDVSQRVTMQTRAARMQEVLGKVLQGTGLRAVVAAKGVLAVEEIAMAERQESGTIAGKIVSKKTKQPIAGVRISVEDGSGKDVLTEADGTFQMSVAKGEHLIRIRGVGFAQQTQRVSVAADEVVNVAILLDPSANVLDQVVVTGTVVATERRAVTTPITVLTAEDIQRRGITKVEQLFRGDVPNVVALETGTAVYGAGDLGGNVRSTVYARGASNLYGDASPLKTYVDGVEISDPSLLGTIDVNSIERMEIVTGPQAATIYGSGALGGVMQIFTKKGDVDRVPELTLTLRYGLLENSFVPSLTPAHNDGLALNGGGPGFSYAVNGSYLYTGQWQPGLWSRGVSGSLGVSRKAGAFSMDASIMAGRQTNGSFLCPDANGAARPGSLIMEKYRENGEVDVRNASQQSCLSIKKIAGSTSGSVALNADYRLFQIWQHHVTLGQSIGRFAFDPMMPTYWFSYDTLVTVQKGNSNAANLSYNTTLARQFGIITSTINAGIDRRWNNGTTMIGCLGNGYGSQVINCYGSGGPYVTETAGARSVGGFGDMQIGILNRVFTQVSIRGEQNSNYGAQHKMDWTPKYGLTTNWDIGASTIKALVSYGRATVAPGPDEANPIEQISPFTDPPIWTYKFANPNLRPEVSKGIQYGIEFYAGSLFSLTVNRYEQKVSDLIQSLVVDSVQVSYTTQDYTYMAQQIQSFNVGILRSHGWSGTVTATVWRFNLGGTYSWDDSRTEYAPGITQYAAGQVFNQLPAHTASVRISYAHRGTSLMLVTNYVGASLQADSRSNAWYLRNQSVRHKMYNAAGYRTTIVGVPRFSRGYAKSNLTASHRLSPQVSMTLNITNLNNSYRSDLGTVYPTLGRQTLIGVSVRGIGQS